MHWLAKPLQYLMRPINLDLRPIQLAMRYDDNFSEAGKTGLVFPKFQLLYPSQRPGKAYF